MKAEATRDTSTDDSVCTDKAKKENPVLFDVTVDEDLEVTGAKPRKPVF